MHLIVLGLNHWTNIQRQSVGLSPETILFPVGLGTKDQGK